MTNEDGFLEEGDSIDEDIFDFEFDDLPEGDIEGTSKDSASEDEVIELVDVVEEGDVLGDLDVGPELGDFTMAMNEDEIREGESDDLTIAMESDDFLDQLDEEEPGLSLDVDSPPETSLEGPELSEEPELDFEESDLESLAEVEGDDESTLELEDLVEPEDIEVGAADQEDDLLEDDDSYATEVVEELEDLPGIEAHANVLERLSKAIGEYDFEQALEELDNLGLAALEGHRTLGHPGHINQP